MLLFSKSFSVSIENHSCYLIKENKIYTFLLLKDHYANMHVQKFKNVCTWLTCAYLWFRLGFRGLQQGFLFRFWERFLLSFGVDRPLLGSRFRPTVLLGFGSVFVGAFRLVGWRRPKQGTEVRILQATKNTSPPLRCGPGAFKYAADYNDNDCKENLPVVTMTARTSLAFLRRALLRGAFLGWPGLVSRVMRFGWTKQINWILRFGLV